MLDFDIYLYPNDNESIDDSFDAIEEDIIFLLKLNLLEKNPKKNKVLNNIWSGNYRGALALLDGTNRNNEDELIKIQNETKKLFNPKELEMLFNIITNTALMGPSDIELLWGYMGHRILYEELCKKPISLFSKPVNEQLRTVLENGSFWESSTLTYDNSFFLYEKNLKFIERFLMNDYHKIDLLSGARGLESALKMISMDYLYTSRKKDKSIYPSIMLSDINYQAIENYYSIIKDIYNNKSVLKLDDEEVGVLLIPRLLYDFENEIILDEDDEVNEDLRILSDPFMYKMINNTQSLKSSIAEYLINDDYKGIDEDVFESIKNFPCKNEILAIAGGMIMDNTIINSDENNKPYFYEKFIIKYDEKNMDEKIYYYPSVKEMFKHKFN